MNKNDGININFGCSPLILTTLILILMQYLDIINWSPVWLLFPIWGGIAFYFILAFIIIVLKVWAETYR